MLPEAVGPLLSIKLMEYHIRQYLVHMDHYFLTGTKKNMEGHSHHLCITLKHPNFSQGNLFFTLS